MASTASSFRYGIPYYYEPTAGVLPGSTVWEQSGLPFYFADPGAWVRFHEDFEKITIASNTFGGFTFTSATSGSVAADATVPNGVIKIDAGAVTAGQGVNFQCNQIPVKLHATLPTVFEARVKFTALTSLKVQALVGLAAIQTALITSNAVGTDDKIAFTAVTTSGAVLYNTTASSTATTGAALTLVNATYYRFGIVATTSLVTFYVNGVSVGSSSTNIPTAALSPSFTCQANATVQPVMHVDYVSVLAPRG